MKKWHILLIIWSITILTGCWSKKEINETVLINSMAIDKGGRGYILSIQSIVPRNAGKENLVLSAPSDYFEADSENICDAFRRLTYILPRFPILAHVANIIISEEVAKEGITKAIDCLMRDDEIRPTVSLFIAKEGNAKDFLKITTILESNSSAKIAKLIKNAETNYSAIHSVKLYSFVNSLTSEESEAYLPGLKIEGNVEIGKDIENVNQTEPITKIFLVPYAVFKNDKLVGWLDEYTSKGVNLLLNEIQSTMVSVECDENKYIALDVEKPKSKIKVKIKNNIPKIKIESTVKGMFCQIDCKYNLHKSDDLHKIEKQFAEVIKKQIEDSIKKLQELDCDIVGFGSIVHRQNPKYWKKNSKDWDNIFPTIEVDVKVKVIATQTGSTINPLEPDIK